MPNRNNRVLWLLILLLLASLACRAVTELPRLAVPPVPTITNQPTWTFIPLPATPTPTRPASPTLPLEPPRLTPLPAALDVRVHPDGGLFVGDLVSFEVLAPPGFSLDESRVEVALPGEPSFAQADFSGFGIDSRSQATLLWVWDTQGLAAGDYELEFSLLPNGPQWEQTFTLLPAEDLPEPLRSSTWALVESDCCVIHYMTGTAAERDIESLKAEIDRQASLAARRMGVEFDEPVTITLLPRLLGHGGFANTAIHVSYLDRNPSGGLPEMVIHHEMVHILDRRLGGELRPSLFVEGLAVYLTGGHFKPEPLMPRAAVLLPAWGSPQTPGLGWYIPLEELADNFYPSQHEIGYLQGGALVEFMVNEWGWEAFSEFYRDIEPHPSGQDSSAIDAALLEYFDLSLYELETRFINELRRQPVDLTLREDVRLTVQFYDTLRRYQQAYDPSAFFRTAWLLDTEQMRQDGIVADYLRHPSAPANLALETLLAAAGEDILAGDYRRADGRVAAVNAVLQAREQDWPDPFAANPLAFDHYQVVWAVLQNPDWLEVPSTAWIEPQRIRVEDDGTAEVWLSVDGSELQQVILEYLADAWQPVPAPVP
jgi:hypothetical protein